MSNQKKVKERSEMKGSNYASRVTIMTLLGYACGLIVERDVLLSVILFIILSVLTVILSTRTVLFYQSSWMLVKFILTTYIFGTIHSYTFTQVQQFINQDPSQPQVWPLFEIYLSFMCVYYYFEFQLNNTFHHHELNWKSFLIYHSKPYLIANTFSLTEHFVAKYLFQFGYKNFHYLIFPAFFFMIFGEGLRISAFFTAKSNFTHLVRYKKDPNHQLITHGVYSFFRHPSYTGYFYFSVFSQLFIGNWLSTIAFFIVLVKFFNERIHDQEYMLASFFEKYLFYKKKTHILIPFVKSPDSQDILKFLIKRAKSNRNQNEDSEDDQ